MDRIDDFGKFNQKNSLLAKDYVENNFLRLIQHFEIEDLTEDQQKEELIKYFTRFPDQIKRFNIQTVGGNRTQYAPRLNNIGGYVKYR
jgi:hypothetical protein